MKASRVSITLAAALAVSGARAHHSWAGVYDTRKSVTLEGVVSEFLFQSPHLALRLEVRNDLGELEEWVVEWGSPRRMREAGHDAGVFQPGDRLVVTGQPAWTPGRKTVRMRSITRTSDGFTMSGRVGRR